MVFKVIIIIFGGYIAYQLVRMIFGGSWSTEDLIAALLVLNISVTFSLARRLESLSSEVRHLRSSFQALAADFKTLKKDYDSHLWKFHNS